MEGPRETNLLAVEFPNGRNETALYGRRSLRSSHLQLPNLANKNRGCPVKFEFHVHKYIFFKYKYVPNIAQASYILPGTSISTSTPNLEPYRATFFREFGISALEGYLRLSFNGRKKRKPRSKR